MDAGVALLILSVILASYLTLLGFISGFYIIILQRFRIYWTSKAFPEKEFAVRRWFRFLLTYFLFYSILILNVMGFIGAYRIADVSDGWMFNIIGGFAGGLITLYKLITKMEEVVMYPPPTCYQPEKS